MTRLTDEHMALLEASLAKIENDYRSTCESAPYGNGCPGPTDESLDFWRRAVDCIPAMLAELRALRLSAALREYIDDSVDRGIEDGNTKAAREALARLGGGE